MDQLITMYKNYKTDQPPSARSNGTPVDEAASSREAWDKMASPRDPMRPLTSGMINDYDVNIFYIK